MESLRLTLLKVEQGADPEQDAEALAELKRILLQRIADLEAIEALESAAVQSADEPNPADLVSPVMTVDESKDLIVAADPSTPPAEPE